MCRYIKHTDEDVGLPKEKKSVFYYKVLNCLKGIHTCNIRAVDNFYSLGGHNRSECQCGLNFIGMPCTYKPTCIHNKSRSTKNCIHVSSHWHL